MTHFLATDLRSGLIYIAEPARKGSRKLNASAMIARVREGMTNAEKLDRRVPWGKVPLYLRKAAREALS